MKTMTKGYLCACGIVVGVTIMLASLALGMNRYPVGQPVPAEVYTAPLDPCDPAYKFLAPPPKDWAVPFGNNERTMLIHAVSELRVIVASQGKRLLTLEKRVAALEPVIPVSIKAVDAEWVDPNEVKLPDDVVVRPNEGVKK